MAGGNCYAGTCTVNQREDLGHRDCDLGSNVSDTGLQIEMNLLTIDSVVAPQRFFHPHVLHRMAYVSAEMSALAHLPA